MDKNQFEQYMQAFLKQNSVINLISKNDEKFLWEKHVFDSLSLSLFFEKYGYPESILDIGTGGGFPSVPIAVAFPQINVYALDSIAKKLNAIENIKQELGLNNLHTLCTRVENYKEKQFKLVTSRAVASLDKLIRYAEHCIKPQGYFVAFKSKLLEEELNNAKTVLKRSSLKLIDTIEYELPTEEKHVRKLVVFKHN